MDIQSLKQRLSLKNISQSILHVIVRIPVAISFLFLLSVFSAWFIIIEDEPTIYHLCLIAFLSGGTIISMVTSLWGEEQTNKRKRWIAEGIALALCAAYCICLFLTDIIPNRGLPAFNIGNAAWMIAVIIMIPFGSFLHEKDDLKAWHFSLSLCAALVISGIVTWVMIGGLEGLVLGTAALFDFEPNSKLCLIIMEVCMILLWGLLGLALIPAGQRKHNNALETPSVLTKVVSWLLLPLLGCYILVLYAYGITILVHWELPKGMLSWLVSAVMCGYLFCYVLLYPQVMDKQSWQSKVLTFWLPILILPLLVLMTVGVARRFMDYGITPPRLYLLTLLLWFYAICIVMLTVPRKRFHWIFFSFAALFLLSSGHPLNYYRICRPILANKIDKMIAEHSDELEAELLYMRECYGEDFVSRWYIPEDEFTSTGNEEKQQIWTISYYKHCSGNLCPQGYTKFCWVDRNSVYLPDKITEDSLYNGILHITHQDGVLLFDTAAIRKAQKETEWLVIPSQDQQMALSVQGITITAYSDSTINISYSGYIFTKE